MKSPKIPAQPTPPPPPAPPPTIDEAARSADEADKLRRRKGRLATVFAGRQPDGGGQVQVGTKSLTGQ